MDPDTGPRCVPLIHDGAVYLYGAAGDLHCVSLADGKQRWSRPMLRDFDGDEGYFGAGGTPIVVGGRLLVNVGGRDTAGLVAVGLADGATLWKATDERASYSAPTAVALDGRPYAIFVTRLNVVCVDPRDGSVRFRFPFGRRGPTVNAATPLVFDGRLFVTANYGTGARLVRIGKDGAEPVWENDESLSSQYPTPVYRDGFLYGIHGREDVGVGQLRCIEAATGKVAWSVPDFGMAHLILAGDRLLILSVQGRLLLAAASADRLETLATATVSTSITRALPRWPTGGCMSARPRVKAAASNATPCSRSGPQAGCFRCGVSDGVPHRSRGFVDLRVVKDADRNSSRTAPLLHDAPSSLAQKFVEVSRRTRVEITLQRLQHFIPSQPLAVNDAVGGFELQDVRLAETIAAQADHVQADNMAAQAVDRHKRRHVAIQVRLAADHRQPADAAELVDPDRARDVRPVTNRHVAGDHHVVG